MAEIETTPGTASEKPKRKTVTSNAAKLKYNKKTYFQCGVKLRYDQDAVIISELQRLQDSGLTASAAVKKMLYDAISGRE